MARKVTEEKEEIVKAENHLPSYLQQYADMGSVGLENLQKEDFVMPRLSIAQGISHEVTKGDPLLIPGLEVGQFFNTVTQEIYGDMVKITPLIYFPSRIYFSPRGSNDPNRCMTRELNSDGELFRGRLNPEGCSTCPHSKFLDEKRQDGTTSPDCTFFFNYISLVHRGELEFEPIALSLKSKMLKQGKIFNSKMRMRRIPAFCLTFDLTTTPTPTPRGTFFNIVITPSKDVTQEQVAITYKLYAEWGKRKIDIDTKGADVPDESGESEEVPF